MKQLFTYSLTILLLVISGCGNKKSADNLQNFQRDQLIAWCIVPFDAMERTPVERAQMLLQLGMRNMAYDYREQQLPTFEEEIGVLRAYEIELSAVWLWIQDAGGQLLDPTSEKIVSTVENRGVRTMFWVSFPAEYFEGLSDEEKLSKTVATLGALNARVEKVGCSIGLYNHGDWFGEPENQMKIIETIGSENISMVYNFHHAHHQIDRFGELLPVMMPYLSVINLNGMTAEGPKIQTIGDGEREKEMLKILIDAGYKGRIGIIGHTEGEDIRVVLERNLKGLEKLIRNLESEK